MAILFNGCGFLVGTIFDVNVGFKHNSLVLNIFLEKQNAPAIQIKLKIFQLYNYNIYI